MSPSERARTRLPAFRWYLLGVTAVALLPVVLFGALLVRRSALEERAESEQALVASAELVAGALERARLARGADLP